MLKGSIQFKDLYAQNLILRSRREKKIYMKEVEKQDQMIIIIRTY